MIFRLFVVIHCWSLHDDDTYLKNFWLSSSTISLLNIKLLFIKQVFHSTYLEIEESV